MLRVTGCLSALGVPEKMWRTPPPLTTARANLKLRKRRLDFWDFSLDHQDSVYKLAHEKYRMLCRKHHPDRGGNPEHMAQVNLVWNRFIKLWSRYYNP